jgi:hypothetical protein
MLQGFIPDADAGRSSTRARSVRERRVSTVGSGSTTGVISILQRASGIAGQSTPQLHTAAAVRIEVHGGSH